jgi:hypothetical protein
MKKQNQESIDAATAEVKKVDEILIRATARAVNLCTLLMRDISPKRWELAGEGAEQLREMLYFLISQRASQISSPDSQPQVTKGKEESKTDEEIAHAYAVNISNIGLLDSDRSFVENATKEILRAIRESKGKEERGWIKTADRPPTEEDGDKHGEIFVRTTLGYAFSTKWTNYYWTDEGERLLNEAVENWPLWMPIPPVPPKKRYRRLHQRSCER